MASISINKISAFDATKANTVTFIYSGNQCFKNELIIYNNTTGNVVFSEVVTTFDLSHSIPANILANGTTYYCKIKAYYNEIVTVNGTSQTVESYIESSPSNLFKCLSTPVWNFSGISNGDVISNSYITFKMNYTQAQNELVNEYYIVIYNAARSVFWSSGVLYDTASETIANGLIDGTIYYIRAYGTTLNGLYFDTRNSAGEDIEISADYAAPSLFSLVGLENNKFQGTVKISTNVASIEGRCNFGEPSYSNGVADLTSLSVIFDDGFNLRKDFILEGKIIIALTSFTLPFITLEGVGIKVTARLNLVTISGVDYIYFFLKEENTGYYLCSNMIDITGLGASLYSTKFHFWIQRTNGLFKAQLTKLEG